MPLDGVCVIENSVESIGEGIVHINYYDIIMTREF